MQDQSDNGRMEKKIELLSVRVGEQEYAIDIRYVHEIKGWGALTRLPFAPDFIKGMMNLRGKVLVVVDLARRLGLECREFTQSSVVVVAEYKGCMAGLMVDGVCDIVAITESMRQKTPETGSDLPKSFIEGLVMMEDQIISILSIASVIPDEQIQRMAEEFSAGAVC